MGKWKTIYRINKRELKDAPKCVLEIYKYLSSKNEDIYYHNNIELNILISKLNYKATTIRSGFTFLKHRSYIEVIEVHREKKERSKDKTKINTRARAKKYKLSVDQLGELLNNHSKTCDICGISEKELSRGLYIDHNHETGEVRGLLCVNCNSGIGVFDENIANIEMAIAYLNNLLD